MDVLKFTFLLLGVVGLSKATPHLPVGLGSKFANHSCVVEDLETKRDGFVAFVQKRVSCKNIVPADFTIAVCEERCRDPVKTKTLSKKLYIPKPIKYFQRFSIRSGEAFEERLTLSCRCVATKRGLKKSQARRQRENRRQKRD